MSEMSGRNGRRSFQVGKKEVRRVLGPNERYYQTSHGATTDVVIYSYHRSLGRSQEEARARLDHVMSKHQVMTQPRR